MKKLLLGLGIVLLTSAPALATHMSTDTETNKDFSEAVFSTQLWFCDSETAFKELADSMDIKNNLGCAHAIEEAKLSLEASEIIKILNQHIVYIKQIQAFEAEVKLGKGYIELVPSVKALRDNGIELNLIKRNSDLTEDEMIIVELSFEESKSEFDRLFDDK